MTKTLISQISQMGLLYVLHTALATLNGHRPHAQRCTSSGSNVFLGLDASGFFDHSVLMCLELPNIRVPKWPGRIENSKSGSKA